MSQSTPSSAVAKVRIPALVSIAADLERTLTATTNFADAAIEPRDADLAFRSLALSVNRAIDALALHGGKITNQDLGTDLSDAACRARMDALMHELAASLPPIRGGGPDDHEEIDPEFLEDPAGWPAEFTPELDGYIWNLAADHQGETPVEVLALDQPTWEPSDAEWDDLYAASGSGLSEADHLAVHGCC